MKVQDNCLDSQLWHACAGGMVQMPSVNAKVYYFPQGHAEHAQGNVDFGGCPRVPGMILCRVVAIKFMADRDTDEVFAKMHLVPVRPNEADYSKDDGDRLGCNGSDVPEKPASFAKTLTQSDANNGGGFSVPRYCAETIFPRLDYSASPPVQTVLARDVHGEIWKFRHIYRGTPRRHLLTTGWSTFVDRKKLVAGDSVVFLRAANGDLCIGIRRAKRGIGSGLESPSGWNLPSGNCLDRYGGFSVFMREEECKLMRNNGAGGNVNASSGITGRGKVGAESVIEAATLAANGQPFEVVYYPRASTPEFCVKASSVREATRIPWASGMRFKMAFETEDSSRISWFMGTISAVQVADPMRWPNSPWRILQVTWDEPDLLQNVKNVSPWLAELVSNIPAIHMTPFSSPRKKMRLPQHPEFPFIGQVPTPMFPTYPIWPSSSPLCYPPDGTPAGIQGARHAQFDIPLLDLHLNKLQSSLFPSGTHPINHGASPVSDENISCLLTTGSPSHSMKEASGAKAPTFMLFGQPILTEEQLSLSSSRGTVSAVLTGNSSSGGNTEKSTTNLSSDGSGSAIHQVGPSDISSCDGSPRSELGLETGHCKVFMESEDVGRTLDLSALGSYEELYRMLGNLFEIEKSDVMNHVLYRDSAGAMRHTGDEPFSDFSKTVRKLTILMDSGSDNTRR